MSTETDHLVALDHLQRRYADIVTRRAWAELSEVFRPDTVIHLDTVTAPPRDLVGPDEFAAAIGSALDRFDHFAFVILNAVVELDAPATGNGTTDEPDAPERRARGRIFMCEIRHEVQADAWSSVHGLYQDSYVHREGRWWIAERHYRSLARTGPDDAVFGLPAGLGPLRGPSPHT